MTKLERAKVVELLRCAADGRGSGRGLVRAGYETGHCDGIKPCTKVYSLACTAYMSIHQVPSVWYWARPRRPLLEAAARVEEGSWP